ncbi:hypothetical protein RMSM_01954 [Rhodopirellula maiorica SM1]|uniref:Uncharacterized protein n=1 Tax=Rhodopirellula maiorica SM1 TaxID=1265738 RepID=M5RP61_9BACT|nr:hypothetical protein RMSM_01954 [Rhodopirellula maiorica SM1]
MLFVWYQRPSIDENAESGCHDHGVHPIPGGDTSEVSPVLTRFTARRRLLVRLRVPLGSIGCGSDDIEKADRRRFNE